MQLHLSGRDFFSHGRRPRLPGSRRRFFSFFSCFLLRLSPRPSPSSPFYSSAVIALLLLLLSLSSSAFSSFLIILLLFLLHRPGHRRRVEGPGPANLANLATRHLCSSTRNRCCGKRDWVGTSAEKTPLSMAAFETTISCLKDAEKQTPQDTLQLSGCGTGHGEQ